MRILIAEDERITRATLVRQLEGWGHAVTASEDGEKAWEHFKTGSFDIVVTDWEMPLVSGLELVKRIRDSAAATYVYVLMLTSRNDKSDIVSGIEAGADDFVSKPFDREELRVRLFAGERIVRLERALKQQNAELRDASERIHEGLRAAARVQSAMLPRHNIQTPHVRTAWKYVPTEELAGDAIGLHLLDDRYLVSYVLDVSGHGVPAALLSVSAMHAMEPMSGDASLLKDLTGASGLGSVRRPARVAAELNRRFRAGENDWRYLTMILCVLDTRTGLLTFTRAGHPPPMILRGEQVIEPPDAGGLPIAVMDDTNYDDGSVQLEPGDRVCLYSDGILEQLDSHDQQFGQSRLLAVLKAGSQAPIEPVTGMVVDALSRWCGGATSFGDDVSLVVIEWLGR
jgi:sigma-B regulation protein RsbU (phosphoserine phosphatase)